MRFFGYNGEINMLLGNFNWVKVLEVSFENVWGEVVDDLILVVNFVFSDFVNLDVILELMVWSGWLIIDSLIILVFEVFCNQFDFDSCFDVMVMYEFNVGIQEFWDGLVLLVFVDGK